MAATSVTILKEYAEKDHYTIQDRLRLQYALDYAPCGNEISYTLYFELKNAIENGSQDDLREQINLALMVAEQKYKALGAPASHEEWQNIICIIYNAGYYWSDDCGMFIKTATQDRRTAVPLHAVHI